MAFLLKVTHLECTGHLCGALLGLLSQVGGVGGRAFSLVTGAGARLFFLVTCTRDVYDLFVGRSLWTASSMDVL